MGFGDNVVVIGIGGVGQYMVQEAKALGASTVVAIDINSERLEQMLSYGAVFLSTLPAKARKKSAKNSGLSRRKTTSPIMGGRFLR